MVIHHPGARDFSLAAQFEMTFGLQLKKFIDIYTGFDTVALDDHLEPYADGLSMKDIIAKRHGDLAVTLVEKIMELAYPGKVQRDTIFAVPRIDTT